LGQLLFVLLFKKFLALLTSDYVLYLIDVVRVVFQVSFERFRLSISLLVLIQQMEIVLLRQHVGNSQIPKILLFFLVSYPKVDEIFGVSDTSYPGQSVMACEHSEFGLVKLVDLRLHALRAVMHRQVVLVHEKFNKIFCFLLLDVLFPYSEDIDSATFIIGSSESILVVSITLAVVETD
jgi:hypothetical protein